MLVFQAQTFLEGLYERGDGGLLRFNLRGKTKIAKGLGGDGADGGSEDFGWEGEVGGFQQGEEVLGCGGAGEGDGVGVVFGVAKEGSDLVDGGFRDDGAVGRGDGDVGSGGAESFGEVVAGLLGADEEETGGCGLSRKCGGLEGVGEQGCCEGFGYGLWGVSGGG